MNTPLLPGLLLLTLALAGCAGSPAAPTATEPPTGEEHAVLENRTEELIRAVGSIDAGLDTATQSLHTLQANVTGGLASVRHAMEAVRETVAAQSRPTSPDAPIEIRVYCFCFAWSGVFTDGKDTWFMRATTLDIDQPDWKVSWSDGAPLSFFTQGLNFTFAFAGSKVAFTATFGSPISRDGTGALTASILRDGQVVAVAADVGNYVKVTLEA